MTSKSRVQSAILADDSVAVFNERTQRMLSLNRTAAYLWFRHRESDLAELAADLAARTGMDLADSRRTIDEHITTWKAAGFIEADAGSDELGFSDRVTTESQDVAHHSPQTEKFDRAAPSRASISGQLSGLNFCVRFEPDGLGLLIEPALQHLLGRVPSPDLTIDVWRSAAGWRVLDGERTRASGLAVNEIVPVVIYALLDGLLRRAANSIAFHASAARRDGRCVLLAAPAGSGKSTLCAALLKRGYELIADDVVLFEEGRVGLRGVPLPLSLKEGSWAPLAKLYPDLAATAVHVRPDRKLVRFLVPPAFAPADESYAVTAVIFPRFISGTDVALRGIDQSLALNRLVSEASTPALRLSGDQFADLASFVRPTSCWALDFSALAPAVDAIEQVNQATPPE
jgi:coenzyme PQQ synthesis protein D (PqqD)